MRSRLRLTDAALFEQQSPQGVTGRVHPGPGLCVIEPIIKTNGLFEITERKIMVLLAVFQFTKHHRLTDGQDIVRGIVEEKP